MVEEYLNFYLSCIFLDVDFFFFQNRFSNIRFSILHGVHGIVCVSHWLILFTAKV